VQKIALITKVVATLFLILVLWGIYAITSLTLAESDNNNLNYIPEDASVAIKIDGRKLMKMSYSSVLFHEDEEVIDLIRESLERQGTEEYAPTGIQFNSDILVFISTVDGHKLSGILLNLNSTNLFDNNIHEYLSANTGYASMDNVGLILSEISNSDNNQLSPAQLKTIAKEYLVSPSKFDKKRIEFNSSEESMILKAWFQPELSETAANVSISVNDKKVSVLGKINLSNYQGEELYKLEPEGLHFNGTHFNEMIADSIDALLHEIDPTIPKLKAISINYFGIEIITDPIFFPAPNFDALLSFESNVNLSSTVDSLQKINALKKIGPTSFNYNGLVLNYEQVDSSTVFIGLSETPSLVNTKNKYAFEFNGDIKNVTRIEGRGMMKKIIEMSPLYQSSATIAEEISSVNFVIENNSSKAYNIKGELEFENNEHALNSILKFLMSNQLFE
jgi:hypothetical protein